MPTRTERLIVAVALLAPAGCYTSAFSKVGKSAEQAVHCARVTSSEVWVVGEGEYLARVECLSSGPVHSKSGASVAKLRRTVRTLHCSADGKCSPIVARPDWTTEKAVAMEEPATKPPDVANPARPDPAASGEPQAGNTTAAPNPPPKETVEGSPSVAAPPPDEDKAIREALDANRDAILACAGAEIASVRVSAGPPITIGFNGKLAGSPEEQCLRSAISTEKLPAMTEGSVVIHVLR